MDTKDVTLFLTIARLGSISRTAEQLFMSQSTVTHHLQRLERALGYTLFHRTPGGVQLTAEGQRLVPLAERMAALERMMLHPDEEQTPVVRVLSGRAFVSVDVPACLSRVVRQMKVHLKVRMGLYDDMVDALLSQQVDFCFLGEPIYHPLVRQVEFLPDAIDLVVPADHYFTHEFPGVQAIAGEPYIAFGRSRAPFRQRVERLLAKAGVYPQVRMELDSIDGVKAMVSHGLGISLLPRRTLNDAAYKGYRAIPLPGDDWVRPTLLAYPAAHAERTLTHQFVEIVRQYYDELKQSSS